MPFVRVAHRAPAVVPVRQELSSHRMVTHRPVNRRPPVAPMVLPILQPPTFSKQSDFIYEEEEQHQDEIRNHLVTVDNDRNKKITRQISVRVPTFIPQQNYPKQPIARLPTRSIRRAEPKYSPHLYSIR